MNIITLHFPPEEYKTDPEDSATRASVMGMDFIYTGGQVDSGSKPSPEVRCTKYIGCRYVGKVGAMKKHVKHHTVCPIDGTVFPANRNLEVRGLYGLHERACRNHHNNTPITKPTHRLFATALNLGVWIKPKLRPYFVRLDKYSNYDFRIVYNEEDQAGDDEELDAAAGAAPPPGHDDEDQAGDDEELDAAAGAAPPPGHDEEDQAGDDEELDAAAGAAPPPGHDQDTRKRSAEVEQHPKKKLKQAGISGFFKKLARNT
ncbi:hypothetical protein TI39_contig4208g00018 [Zymoseptoria brevis]|uniref:Uncharacterized protein n=1 Tax=Zymoseptoria brevis TaxID=1047168 RepID=A0A0F4GDD5_9PEZI|nr:hypothetical protein TI39_contig4208g00018 [Zymoseptoria brevis]